MDLYRRYFVGGAGALAVQSAPAAKEQTYRFRTADAEIEMAIEFHDGYASRGFWFGEQMSKRRCCLSADGKEASNCLGAFRGSVAIARYRVRPRSRPSAELVLREYVRTIDRDVRLPDRPPFGRSIALTKGIGSDLQAFGFESASENERLPDRPDPWYLYRQDLYLEPKPAPFLILYSKHALTSIRVLDLIPGDHIWIEKE